jgi:hypothetical protein
MLEGKDGVYEGWMEVSKEGRQAGRKEVREGSEVKEVKWSERSGRRE